MKAFGAALLLIFSLGLVPGAALAQGIYSCVDAKGRKITSDRPIPECLDRVQQQFNANGTVRRDIGPSLSPAEQAAADDRARAEKQEQSRKNEEKRRERALLARYPDQESHDRVRATSLAHIAETIRTAKQQIDELATARKQLDTQMEFYKANPAKAPATLRHQIEDNEARVAAQRRFIGDQEAERNRVNAQFDDELVILKRLWQQASALTTH